MSRPTPYELLKECFDEVKTCDPMNRQTVIKGFAAIQELREEAIRQEAQAEIWKELKRGDGLYTNESGCREVHVDYIDERLSLLTPQPQHPNGAQE